MIHSNLNINKAFREQVEKCMKTTFVAITQPFIRATLLKKKTIVLVLILFYYIREENIASRVLSYVIYIIIRNNVCIDSLSFQ